MQESEKYFQKTIVFLPHCPYPLPLTIQHSKDRIYLGRRDRLKEQPSAKQTEVLDNYHLDEGAHGLYLTTAQRCERLIPTAISNYLLH
jgi:hypothetical protein